jgi:hypothetical protein
MKLPRYCPVCWGKVYPTGYGNVASHWDSALRDQCPMTGHPYHLVGIGRRPRRRRVAA